MSGMYPTNEEIVETAKDMLKRFDTSPGGTRFFDGERPPAWMTVLMYTCEDASSEQVENRL